MKSIVSELSKSHATKGISPEEFERFSKAIRQTFREVLNEHYTERMDSIWKQFLELLVLFMGHATTQDNRNMSSGNEEDEAYMKGLAGLISGYDKTKPASDKASNTENHGMSLDFVLKDPEYLLFFSKFLGDDGNDESLLFLLAVDKFREEFTPIEEKRHMKQDLKQQKKEAKRKRKEDKLRKKKEAVEEKRQEHGNPTTNSIDHISESKESTSKEKKSIPDTDKLRTKEEEEVQIILEGKKKRMADKLYKMYVKPGALLQVTLSSTIINSIEDAILTDCVTGATFDSARRAMFSYIERGSYVRFLASIEYATASYNAQKQSGDPTALQAHRSEKLGKEWKNTKSTSMRNNAILLRSFAIAIAQSDSGGSKTQTPFTELFYEVLFMLSPEAKLLFNNSLAHQGTMLSNVLVQLLAMMQEDDSQFNNAVKRLAGTHVHMGITSTMFHDFGNALIITLRRTLQMEEDWGEWLLLERKWQEAYHTISAAMIRTMVTMPQTKAKVPKWLAGQLNEYKRVTSETIGRIKRGGKVQLFQEIFYSNFFLLSSESEEKFLHVSKQGEALWGALDSVVAMLKNPKKMHSILQELAKSHAHKGISQNEYRVFTQTIRSTFRDVLRQEYTETMDSVWKQFLELLIQFMSHGSQSSSFASNTSGNEQDAAYIKGLAGMLSGYQNKSHPKEQTVSHTPEFGDKQETSKSGSKSANSAGSGITDTSMTPLTFALLREVLPNQVSDRAVVGEVNKLHDQLIYTVEQLKLYSLDAISNYVCSATAHALKPYLLPKAAYGSFTPEYGSGLSSPGIEPFFSPTSVASDGSPIPLSSA